MRTFFVLAGMTGLLAFMVVACSKTSLPQVKPVDSSYYDRQAFVAGLNSNLIVYDSVLKFTGVIDTLEQAGPFTSFGTVNNGMQNAGWGSVQSNGSYNYFGPPANAGFILSSMIFRGTHDLDSSMPVGANQVWMPVTGVPAYVSKYLYQGDTLLYSFDGAQVTGTLPTSNGEIAELGSMPNIQSFSTIDAYIHANQQFTFLAVALQRSGLEKVLSDTTATWTFLAPDNGAFQYASDPSLTSLDSLLVADTAKLANLLRLHLLPGRRYIFDFNVLAGALANGNNYTTDSIRLYAANGLGVDYVNQNGQYFFVAAGDSAQNYWTGQWGPNYISLGNSYDQTTGNGTVHELTSFLLP